MKNIKRFMILLIFFTATCFLYGCNKGTSTTSNDSEITNATNTSDNTTTQTTSVQTTTSESNTTEATTTTTRATVLDESIYVQVQRNGFTGTFTEWLESIQCTEDSIWLSSNVDPNNSVGNNGEYYYNTTSNSVFKKVDNVWNSVTSITDENAINKGLLKLYATDNFSYSTLEYEDSSYTIVKNATNSNWELYSLDSEGFTTYETFSDIDYKYGIRRESGVVQKRVRKAMSDFIPPNGANTFIDYYLRTDAYLTFLFDDIDYDNLTFVSKTDGVRKYKYI